MIEASAPDLRLELRLKNERLYQATIGAYGSVAAFCVAHGRPHAQEQVGKLINLRQAPWAGGAKWDGTTSLPMRPICVWLSAVTGVPADDLFHPELYQALMSAPIVRIVDAMRFVPLLEAARERPLLAAIDGPPPVSEGYFDRAISLLTPRESRVIRRRFGLDTGNEESLESTATAFGVTKERIRQIEAKALRKLRHPSRKRLFGLPVE